MSQAVMKKSRPIKRAEAGVPTGLLDAYTEVPGTKEGMSDSEKFKEGYKKKGKGKVKNPPKKVEEAAEEVEEVEDDGVGESWDDDVVESWDQIDVEEMPVPVKVKKEMRKEEKKRKKDLEKAAKAQDTASENLDSSIEASAASPEAKPQSTASAAPVIPDPTPAETLEVTDAVKKLSIKEDGAKAAAAPAEGQKELTAEEKAAVKADREAKKAEKARRREEAKLKKSADPASAADSGEKPVAAAGKVEEAASKTTFSGAPALPKTSGAEGEKKTTTKAERRAKQEEQRKKKAEAGKGGETKSKETAKVRVPDEVKADDKKTEKKLAKTLISQKVPARTPAQRQIPLFSHLHQYERETSVTKDLPVAGGNLHPAVVQLGLQYAQGEVTGSSERCVALLTALRSLLQDLLPTLNPGPELYRDIDNLIKPNITFLKQCRPLSISMQNAIRYLKKEITCLDKNLCIEEARDAILERIDDFININFILHPKAISETANKKIKSGDVILTFSYSKLVEKVLLDAVESGKKLKVIIADERVEHLGMNLAKNLVNAGVHTTYILLTAVSQILPSATKVLLGCDGVMANGCVLATVGTSQVALLAKSCNKPVTFFSETYKFTERVQTDSFVYNELLDPDSLVDTGAPSQMAQLSDWRDLTSLSLLHLVYDLTPAMLVDSIVTEISEIPPTSVPVILRLHNYKDFHHAEHDQ